VPHGCDSVAQTVIGHAEVEHGGPLGPQLVDPGLGADRERGRPYDADGDYDAQLHCPPPFLRRCRAPTSVHPRMWQAITPAQRIWYRTSKATGLMRGLL
jgi:hypothetical protein